jgi:hypothetical protein
MLRKLFPEWRDMGTVRRAVDAFWTPGSAGVGAAFAATNSTGAWLLNLVFAILGAIGLGAQHRDQRVAVRRAALSGALYAGVAVTGYHLRGHGGDAPAWLLPPHDPLLFLLLFTASFPLHQLGAWLRTRLSPQAPNTEPTLPAKPQQAPSHAQVSSGRR